MRDSFDDERRERYSAQRSRCAARPQLHLLEIDLQHHLDEVARAVRALEDFTSQHALPLPVRRRLALVLDDALGNLVLYGDSNNQPIALRVELEATHVVVVIADATAAFDPLAVPVPDTTSGVHERPIGGLGIHLMRNLMSDVQYGRVGDRNVLRLTLTLAREPP